MAIFAEDTPVNPATDPGDPVPTPPAEPPASEVEIVPRPVPSNSVTQLQAASGTESIANFGTTSVPVSLESDAVLAARNASGTDTADFLATQRPVIGDGVVDAQLASGTDSTAFTTGNNFGTSPGDPAAIQAYNDAQKARLQQTISQQRQIQNNEDWRVKLRLAPQANYLYKDANPGILQPLAVTDGVVFPYTPKIDTQYKANYDPYDLTHANFKGYFYKNSHVDAINLRCMFTAQSTQEADYLLATIHFFRSVTKMFYGQDAQRGAPPPLVYLTGLGEFQFNEHSCVVSAFNYSLPDDVDYIRARSTPFNNTNLESLRDRKGAFSGNFMGNFVSPTVQRLVGSQLNKLFGNGGKPTFAPPTLGQASPTYVPTKMEIAITLLPIQSRSQVSQQFSVKGFANGNLLKGGFW